MHRLARPDYRFLPVWACVLLLSQGPPAAADSVRYEAGRLSVDFRGSDLQLALEQVADATGIEFSISSRVRGDLDERFEDLPLETGLRRLLTGLNFILLHDDGGSNEVPLMTRVVVLGRGSAVAPVRRGPAPAAAPSREEALAVHPPSSSAPSQVVIPGRRSGHYIHPGTINGTRVEFLLDTGATSVAVSSRLAGALGLAYGREVDVETANGSTKGFSTILDRVALGPLRRDRVPAIIMPGMDGTRQALLGMSFLRSFELLQRDGKLHVRESRRPGT